MDISLLAEKYKSENKNGLWTKIGEIIVPYDINKIVKNVNIFFIYFNYCFLIFSILLFQQLILMLMDMFPK